MINRIEITAVGIQGAGKSMLLGMFAKHLRSFGINVHGSNNDHTLIIYADPRDVIRAQAAQAQGINKSKADADDKFNYLQKRINTMQGGLQSAYMVLSSLPNAHAFMQYQDQVRIQNWLAQYNQEFLVPHKHVFESSIDTYQEGLQKHLMCSCGLFMHIESGIPEPNDEWGWASYPGNPAYVAFVYSSQASLITTR